MEDFIPFGSAAYFVLLGILVFARGMDFLSTWIATPNLVLEANPIAKRLGWKLGLLVNSILCVIFAAWPLPAIVISTTSMLVAARNLQSAWLMRSLGEDGYRFWMVDRIESTPAGLYLFCLIAQTFMIGAIGAVLMYFSPTHIVPLGIGMGIITYAVAVSVFTLLSLWRIRGRRV